MNVPLLCNCHQTNPRSLVRGLITDDYMQRYTCDRNSDQLGKSSVPLICMRAISFFWSSIFSKVIFFPSQTTLELYFTGGGAMRVSSELGPVDSHEWRPYELTGSVIDGPCNYNRYEKNCKVDLFKQKRGGDMRSCCIHYKKSTGCNLLHRRTKFKLELKSFIKFHVNVL